MSFNEEFLEYLRLNKNDRKKFRYFRENTPEGNRINGWICMAQNKFYGSLLIERVNNHDAFQMVHGFPKMSYAEDGRNLSLLTDFNMKYDGTNIILYPLCDHKGEVIEVVPKTRRVPCIIDEFFLGLLNDLPAKDELYGIADLYQFTLAIELYGYKNKHMLNYKVDLDYVLIGAWSMYNIAIEPYADEIFMLNHPIDFDFAHDDEMHVYDDALLVEEMMEKINLTSKNLVFEGLVLTSVVDGEYVYYKMKPDTIYKACVCAEGIPTNSVKHSVGKYFDEHHDTAKDDWEYEQNKVLDFIKEDLATDFDWEYVNSDKTLKKIKKVFEDRIAEKEYDAPLVEIAENLVATFPTMELTDLMKVFGARYTYLKRKSSDMYNLLRKLKKEV